MDEKRGYGLGRRSGPVMSGAAYCISSCSMILLNKVVLSSYNFNAGISLMFYQVCHLSLQALSLRINFVCNVWDDFVCAEYVTVNYLPLIAW